MVRLSKSAKLTIKEMLISAVATALLLAMGVVEPDWHVFIVFLASFGVIGFIWVVTTRDIAAALNE